MPEAFVKTPCIGVCSTGIGDSVCRGCKRFAHEVINWNSYSEAQKRAIDGRLSAFLSQSVSNKLRIVDARLLSWQLSVQQIDYNRAHDEYCWLYSLIKAGASQIGDTSEYGFEVLPEFRERSLGDLREMIDAQYYLLSEAHYERYMRSPDLFAGEPR